MKKVFDVYKFIDNMLIAGVPDDKIIRSLDVWAEKCHGLTKEEMIDKRGCSTTYLWMVEVEE